MISFFFFNWVQLGPVGKEEGDHFLQIIYNPLRIRYLYEQLDECKEGIENMIIM